MITHFGIESLINEFENKLIENKHASLEGKRELRQDLDRIADLINRIDSSLATHISLLVTRGINPALEKLNGGICHFKRIKLHALFLHHLKLSGWGFCPHCSRITICAGEQIDQAVEMEKEHTVLVEV